MRRTIALGLAAGATALALVAAAPHEAEAFCGFYVGGADTKLYNNATQVVLMRDGTRTVLSMQNNYEGPPTGFAMVVPVPVTLQKENVKTLGKDVFAHIDQLAAPRLVEYWEQDPCYHPPPMRAMGGAMRMAAPSSASKAMDKDDSYGVKIEAKFTVGEYDIVILSAKDSGGLDRWLRDQKYAIPAASEPYLRPYVLAGSKFFVAKVDPTKVKFENGRANLSPLRFHYDSDTFSLPVRLGLMNSKGAQDLIVHILARGQRYEVANYQNVAIPTNFNVLDKTRTSFGSFYAALFDETMAKHPKSVITEYSWDAGTCDPCPGPPLDNGDLAVLGSDVLPGADDGGGGPRGRGGWGNGFVVTRLHARYTKDALGEDLVFRAAPPIGGGRESVIDDKGKLEQGARPDSINNFQARYAIRHPWTGPIACKNPRRGVWGGPPGGGRHVTPALDLAFAPRGAAAGSFTSKSFLPDPSLLGAPASVPGMVEGGVLAVPQTDDPVQDAGTLDALPPGPATPPATPPQKGGCAGCATTDSTQAGGGFAIVALLGVLAAGLRRRSHKNAR